MKRIIVILILVMTTIGCELVDPNYWERVEKSRKESGETCYRDPSGYFYCEDRDGNRL